ncbi:MAG: zinc ABC transporter substrate-binding protein [Acidaminococcaceae bacterium]|nr:zinc ABC transporter substrate-binding protein [Acidaminococcaceae bacterium]
MRWLFSLLLVLLCETGFAARLQVVASIYPMAEFCRAVGGDLVEVTQLVPEGTEPHDYEPSPQDLLKVGRAGVLVYNGVVDGWACQALESLGEQKPLGLEAGAGLMDLAGVLDPHVWVSPRLAVTQVTRVRDAFCRADGRHAEAYNKNCAAYVARLQGLDREYAGLTAASGRRAFATAHAAFGHLARDYGLTMLAVTGLSPEAEPTPADLQKVIGLVKRYGLRYVFFETLTSPRLAELVALEAGVKTGVLDPIEGVEAGSKCTYLDLQKRNLAALRLELQQ